MLNRPNEESESTIIQTFETTNLKQMERLKTEVIQTIRTEMNESIKYLVDEALVDFRSKFQSEAEEKATNSIGSCMVGIAQSAIQWKNNRLK